MVRSHDSKNNELIGQNLIGYVREERPLEERQKRKFMNTSAEPVPLLINEPSTPEWENGEN